MGPVRSGVEGLNEIIWLSHLHLNDALNALTKPIPAKTRDVVLTISRDRRRGALASSLVLSGTLLKVEDLTVNLGVY